MSEAARLRAQKAYSTDPEYLERMAVAAERRDAHLRRDDVGNELDREAAQPANEDR